MSAVVTQPEPAAAMPLPDRTVASSRGFDRFTTAVVVTIAALVAAGHVLAWFGVLRAGPTLIVGAAGGYSLYALATQEGERPVRRVTGRRTGRLLVLVVVATAVFLGWFATGYPLVDGPEAAHQFVATDASVTGSLDLSIDLAADPAADGRLPGMRQYTGSWTVDDERAWTAALTEVSWLGNDAASRLGAGLAVVLLLATFGLATRLVHRGAALVAVLTTAMSLPLLAAARLLAPSILAAVLIVGGLFLAVEAVGNGSMLGAVPAGFVLGLAPAVDAVWFGLVAAFGAYVIAVRADSAAVGFIARDRVRNAGIGVALGAIAPLVLSAAEAARTGSADRALLSLVPAVVVAAGIGAYRRFGGPHPSWTDRLRVIVAVASVAAAAAGLVGAVLLGHRNLLRLRTVAGFPLLVLGVSGLAILAIETARAPRDVAAPARLLLAFASAAVGVLLVVVLPVGLEATAALLPAVVLLATAAAVAIDRWFADPDRYLLQTLSIVAAASLLIVPGVRLTEAWDLAPQRDVGSWVETLCSLIEVDGAVLVVGVGDDPSAARAIVGTVRGSCGLPAALLPEGRTMTSVDRFARLAYEANRTPYLVSLVALPFGLEGPDLVTADAVDVAIDRVLWNDAGLPGDGVPLRRTVRVGVFE